MSLNKKAIYWVSLTDQCQTEWVRKKYNQIVIFINIHFHHFTTICKGLYIISSDVSAGMLSAHKEYKTMATQHFTPTKSILPNHVLYILKKKKFGVISSASFRFVLAIFTIILLTYVIFLSN